MKQLRSVAGSVYVLLVVIWCCALLLCSAAALGSYALKLVTVLLLLPMGCTDSIG